MHQLRPWQGTRSVLDVFERQGFGFVSHYCSVASQVCNGSFTPEQFLLEQCEAGERFVNNTFLAAPPGVMPGKYAQSMSDNLGTMSFPDRLDAFDLPLFDFREAESRSIESTPPIETKLDAKAYAEEFASGLGFRRHGGKRSRRNSKAFGDWGLEGHFEIDTGGRDRLQPTNVVIPFGLSIGKGLASGAIGLSHGGALGFAGFYGQVLRPRDFTKPPPPRPADVESRMSKHAIRAQIILFDILATSIERAWRN